MRSLKSNGGLTRGAGFKETQRAIWLLSMPISSTFNLKMQELTDFYSETSEQHKSATNARILQDNEDIGKLLSYLKQTSPFTEDGSLRNIATGAIADEGVNVDMFFAFGKTIVKKMDGKDFFKYSLKCSEKAKTLSTKTSVKLTREDDATIDSYLLCQKLVVLAKVSNMGFEDYKEHELCAYPPALFESTSLMQKANKPALAIAIADFVKSKSNQN